MQSHSFNVFWASHCLERIQSANVHDFVALKTRTLVYFNLFCFIKNINNCEETFKHVTAAKKYKDL